MNDYHVVSNMKEHLRQGANWWEIFVLKFLISGFGNDFKDARLHLNKAFPKSSAAGPRCSTKFPKPIKLSFFHPSTTHWSFKEREIVIWKARSCYGCRWLQEIKYRARWTLGRYKRMTDKLPNISSVPNNLGSWITVQVMVLPRNC